MDDITPEIRLKGFNEPWQMRKLGDIAEFNPRSVLPDSFEYIDLESVVGIELISHRTENKDTAPSRAQRLAKKGDVFFQMVRPYQMNNYLFNLPHKNYVFSTGYAQLRPNIDSYFLLYLLQEQKFVTKVIENCTGTSYPAINSTTLANIGVCITQDKEEQTAIGNFFRALDENITLHKQKLDCLKQLKKGYLQQMFPQTGETMPRVRFEGFTETWSIRTLGEISEIKTGASDVQDADPNGEYPFFVRSEKIARSSKYLFDGEAILIPGEGRIGDIYHYINGKFDFHQRVYKISNFANNVNGKFILYTMQKTFKQHAMIHTAKATVDSLRLPILTGFNIQLPSLQEQTAIGDFFYNLDNQIITHTQKVKELKQLKTAYLQKMFI